MLFHLCKEIFGPFIAKATRFPEVEPVLQALESECRIAVRCGGTHKTV